MWKCHKSSAPFLTQKKFNWSDTKTYFTFTKFYFYFFFLICSRGGRKKDFEVKNFETYRRWITRRWFRQRFLVICFLFRRGEIKKKGSSWRRRIWPNSLRLRSCTDPSLTASETVVIAVTSGSGLWLISTCAAITSRAVPVCLRQVVTYQT